MRTSIIIPNKTSFSAITHSIVRAVYGFDIQDTNDPYVNNAEQLMNGLAVAGIPGKFWVDNFPFRTS